MRDGQLMYNRQGAIPDTAPLGGDNRPAGCAGWADASVIVPWEMYLAYGDTRVLEENYECMARWIAYQSLDSRQTAVFALSMVYKDMISPIFLLNLLFRFSKAEAII